MVPWPCFLLFLNSPTYYYHLHMFGLGRCAPFTTDPLPAFFAELPYGHEKDLQRIPPVDLKAI